MLQSMTGFGEGRASRPGTSVVVQLRAVNNRHFKFACRLPDGYAAIESKLEAVVRQQVRRGSVQTLVSIHHEADDSQQTIDLARLRSYHRQLAGLQRELCGDVPLRLDALFSLPGVVRDDVLEDRSESDWPMIEPAVRQAIAALCAMRAVEGAAMAADLRINCDEIAGHAARIELRSPLVVSAYQQRLTERIANLLREHDVAAQPADVIREVGIFADRVDVLEELVRLRSHLHQFRESLSQADAVGRQLEFLVQELLREANTIGSKANDAEIAQDVVQIKTCLERMREMIQNVE